MLMKLMKLQSRALLNGDKDVADELQRLLDSMSDNMYEIIANTSLRFLTIRLCICSEKRNNLELFQLIRC